MGAQHGIRAMSNPRVISRGSICYAISHGHLEVVGILVERGADVNAQSLTGVGGLMKAAAGGGVEMVKCLVDTGAGQTCG